MLLYCLYARPEVYAGRNLAPELLPPVPSA